MKTTKFLAAIVAVAALAVAQKPKSKSELEALQAISTEQDPAAQIKKIDDFVKKFADSDYKAAVYAQAAAAAERMGDGLKVIIYSDLALEADPKAYQPMVLEAADLARSTRENDLDKDEKLAKAEKLAHQGMEIVLTAPKPGSQYTDAQWDEAKKEVIADAHRDLGMIATVRKKYDLAISEYKQAVTLPAQPEPATFIRLAAVYNENKQPDEALAALAKIAPDPRLATFIDKEKKRALALKEAKK